jgi:hypothetical protein
MNDKIGGVSPGEETREEVGGKYLAPVVDRLPIDARPNVWGPGYRKLYMMCSLVYLCSTMNGTYGLGFAGSLYVAKRP